MNVNFKICMKLIELFLFISNVKILEAQIFQTDQGIFFQFINEKKILPKPIFSSWTLLSYTTDKNVCVSYCLTYSSCKSANFRISTGECSLFGVNSWEIELMVVSDLDYIIIQKVKEPLVAHGNWTLVFRGLANIGKSVYDTYIDTSKYHDQPLSPIYPIGCLRLDTNLSCDHHFRSKLLNNWSSLAITEVKFGIYKDGVMQKFLLFNGSSTTFMNWFSSAKLINSSWTDLTTSPVAFFSVMGCYSPGVKRRFYVEHSHPGCNTDNGWFACIDQNGDTCSWGKTGPSFPRLLYSQGTTKIANVYMKSADIMAIFIKL